MTGALIKHKLAAERMKLLICMMEGRLKALLVLVTMLVLAIRSSSDKEATYISLDSITWT